MLEIHVPKPSRYNSNLKVDEIALEANKAYRLGFGNELGFPIDMERFIDLLEVNTLWEEIEEPEGTAFFANYTAEGAGLITINERHRQLFEKRPDVFYACLGHESGHCILRHIEIFDRSTLSLFTEDDQAAPLVFHKSSWYQYGLSHEEVERSKESRKVLNQTLAKNAWISDTAHQALKQIHTHFEPDWVFWQAEHFSLCLRIPRDRIEEELEKGWDFTSWRPIYRLAEMFGVSASMMRLRLEKLNAIELDPEGRPRPKRVSQTSLFH